MCKVKDPELDRRVRGN